MKKIICIHGLGSSGKSNTGRFLKENYNNCEVITPDIPINPLEAANFIKDLLEKEKPDLVVGTSIGGFYVLSTMANYNGKKLVINPAMKAYDDIKNRIGMGEYLYTNIRENGDTKYTIDENFLDELQALQDLYYSSEYKKQVSNTYAVFGTNDELFSHIEDFKNMYDKEKMLITNSNHKLKNAELDLVKNFINTNKLI